MEARNALLKVEGEAVVLHLPGDVVAFEAEITLDRDGFVTVKSNSEVTVVFRSVGGFFRWLRRVTQGHGGK